MPHSHTYHIALGSNLGDRLANLRTGIQSISTLPDTTLLSLAPLYESDPVDCPPDSQSFYNSAAAICSILPPETFLQHLRRIESELGRPNQHDHHAPRTLDLDILCAGPLVLDTPTLILPHPRMTQRRFVLQPLADLAPDLVLPYQSLPVRTLLTKLISAEAPLRLVAPSWL